MAGTYKENGTGNNAEKDDGRKTVDRKKKRKTSSEMDRRCCSRLENNEDKVMEGENERWRATEAGCGGRQVSPRTRAPRRWKYITSLIELRKI